MFEYDSENPHSVKIPVKTNVNRVLVSKYIDIYVIYRYIFIVSSLFF